MTVPKQQPYNNWNGDGENKTFDFDFFIENETQLKVSILKNDKIIAEPIYNVDYSIGAFNNENGSHITFPLEGSEYAVLASDEIISLSLVLPIEQSKPYPQSEGIQLKKIEKGFDYVTRLLQIQDRKLERALTVEEGASTNANDLFNAFKLDINATITSNKAELEQAQDEFENDINETLSSVNEASNKINQLETAVNTAIASATTAQTQAGIATTKATELSNAVTDIALKENLSNKVTAFSDTPSDEKYPSEKLVKDTLNNKVNKSDVMLGSQFTINACKLDTDGNVDLLTYSGANLSFNVSSENSLVLTNKNQTRTINSLASISVTGLADGTYFSMIKDDDTVELISSYKVKKVADNTLVAGSVRLDNSVIPLKLLKVVNGAEVEYLATPMTGASVTVASGAVTAIKQPYLNTNGINRELVDSYVNGTSWYRVYSDGFIEQGGVLQTNQNRLYTITFLKSFSDTNYFFTRTIETTYAQTYQAKASGAVIVNSVTTNGLNIHGDVANSGVSRWYACGY